VVSDVVIVGGGPCGLMLACEQSLAGMRPVVLERLAQPPDEIRANGLVGLVVPMLDRRGLYQRLTGDSEVPQPARAFFFGALPLDLAALDDPFYLLPAPQPRIQQVLEERAAELWVEVRRGHELTGLSQRADEVTIDVTCPEGRYEMRCRYVVGADGGHSTTRQLAGIGFPGATNDDVVARTVEGAVPAELVDTATGGLNVPGYGHIPPFISQRTDTGLFAFGNLPSRPPLMFTVEWTAADIDETTPFTLGEFRESVRRVLGADLPLQPPAHRLTRTTGVNTRLAERFSSDRVLLVGDAAHVQFVLGGPGLNLGLQDAATLVGNSQRRYTAGRRDACWTPTTPSAGRPRAGRPCTPRHSSHCSRPAPRSPRCGNCSPNSSATCTPWRTSRT
jgi:2-polyprenyl-6-methoxyphenol hydroxylase-like FAD-dependent oxidoreductase